MDYFQEALKLHREHQGKLEIKSKVEVKTRDDLSLAYTPGVAQPCREIHQNPDAVYEYTTKGNMVAVITDGSAVLGLGNIGPKAALPVMEGKCILFKNFGGVDAIPLCLDTQDTDEIVFIAKNLAPSLGGINLEDIAAPRCFEVERKLQAALDIPVFHDDQHGTAIVTSAAVINAMKLAEKELSAIKVVINGAGSAGIAIARMLMSLGVADIILCDSKGAVCRTEKERLNAEKQVMAEITNPRLITGGLADALKGADVFIGVSAPGVLTREMVAAMAPDSAVFAMANPVPEIMPEEAKAGGAKIIGTGRSDFPNQINNVLVFPGVFKGALAARAKAITQEMKIAAAYAIAGAVSAAELSPDCIIPSVFAPGIADQVAEAVARAWKEGLENNLRRAPSAQVPVR
ncbi:MAG: NADP-dependent malic enzyme [Peptococcaceae bacterium]|nr:NADP-dependent malic enzyme [Peptococcaceae bacterium]